LGIAGASSGIEIANRMHVPASILSAARGRVEPSHAQAREYLRQLKEMLDENESLRASLEEERTAVAEKFSRLDADFAKREESRKAVFAKALDRVLGDFKADSERAARVIKDRIEAARIRRVIDNQSAELRGKSARLRQASDPSVPGSPAPLPADASGGTESIAEGDRVRIRSLDRQGTVETVRDGIFVVLVGSLRYRAAREDLDKAGIAGEPAAEKSPNMPAGDESVEAASELKVIGLTADEAVDRVDQFLDRAFLAGLETVRVIHGHGKGILRNAIAKFLTGHPQVERFSLAPPDKGGGGATIVELKK